MADRQHQSLPVLVLAVALTVISACAGQQEPRLTEAQRQLNVESFHRAWVVIRDKHFDPQLGGVDWPTVREEFLHQDGSRQAFELNHG